MPRLFGCDYLVTAACTLACLRGPLRVLLEYGQNSRPPCAGNASPQKRGHFATRFRPGITGEILLWAVRTELAASRPSGTVSGVVALAVRRTCCFSAWYLVSGAWSGGGHTARTRGLAAAGGSSASAVPRFSARLAACLHGG